MARKKQKKEEEKSKIEKPLVEASQTVSDVKGFIEKFKADVKKKKEKYKSFAQKLKKTK